jgi:hypothetical protein
MNAANVASLLSQADIDGGWRCLAQSRGDFLIIIAVAQ